MTPTSNRSYLAVQSRMIDRNSMATRGMHQDACQKAGDRCSEQEHELDDIAISRCTVSQWAGWMHQTILLLISCCENLDSHRHEYSNQARMEDVGPLLALELKAALAPAVALAGTGISIHMTLFRSLFRHNGL